MMIDVRSIKERIRDARIKSGLSQDEMARRLGIKRNAYRAFEAGATQIVSPRLKDFAALTGCTPEFLLLGYEPSRPEEDLLQEMDGYRKQIQDLTEDYENRLDAAKKTIRDKEALISSQERTIKVQAEMIRMLQK